MTIQHAALVAGFALALAAGFLGFFAAACAALALMNEESAEARRWLAVGVAVLLVSVPAAAFLGSFT